MMFIVVSSVSFEDTPLSSEVKETLAVTTELSIRREFRDLYIPPGKYLLIAELGYANTTAEAHDSFDVLERPSRPGIVPLIISEELKPEDRTFLSIAIIIFAIVAFIVYARQPTPRKRKGRRT